MRVPHIVLLALLLVGSALCTCSDLGPADVSDDLSVSIRSGHLELKNVLVNRSALVSLFPGLSVRYGVVDRLVVDIPWSKPSRGVRVQCHGVLVLLEPPGPDAGAYSAEVVEAALDRSLEAKAKELDDMHVRQVEEIRGKSDAGIFSRMVSSVTSKLTPLIVNNLKIELTDLHIRFEDTSDCASPLCVGTMVECLTMCNASQGWDPDGGHSPDHGDGDDSMAEREEREEREEPEDGSVEKGAVRKLLSLKNFCVYADPHFSAVSSCNDPSLQTLFLRRLLSDPTSCGLDMVVQPVSAEVHLSLSKVGGLSGITAALSLSALQVALSDHQLLALLQLYRRVTSVLPLSVHVERRCKVERDSHLAGDFRASYINMYYKRLAADLGVKSADLGTHGEALQLSLEKWLPVSHVVQLRQVAVSRLKEQGLLGLAGLSRKERKAALGSISVSMGVSATDIERLWVEPEEEPEESESGRTLCLDLALESVDVVVAEHGTGRSRTALDAVMRDGSVQLKGWQRASIHDVGGPYSVTPVASLHVSGLDVDMVLSSTHQLTGRASIDCVTLRDEDSDVVYQELVSTLNRGSAHMEGEGDLKSFLSLDFDINLKSTRDMGSVSLQSLPLLVIAPPAFVSRSQRLADRVMCQLDSILSDSLSPSPSPEVSGWDADPEAPETLLEQTGLDRQALSDFARDLFSSATQQVRTAHVDVSLSAPIVAVPSASHIGDPDIGVLVINLGRLTASDQVSCNTFLDSLAGGRDPSTLRPSCYDTYSVAFQDTEVCFCPSQAAFSLFVQAVPPGSPPVPSDAGCQSLLSGVSTELFVGRSLGGVDVPRVHLSAALDGLCLDVSHKSLLGSLGVVNGLSSAVKSKVELLAEGASRMSTSDLASASSSPSSSQTTSPEAVSEGEGEGPEDWTEYIASIFRADGLDDDLLGRFTFTVVDVSVQRLGIVFGEEGEREFAAAVTDITARAAVHATHTEGSISLGGVLVEDHESRPILSGGGEHTLLAVDYTVPTNVAALFGSQQLGETQCQDMSLTVAPLSVHLARESVNRLSSLYDDTMRILNVGESFTGYHQRLSISQSQDVLTLNDLQKHVNTSVFDTIRNLYTDGDDDNTESQMQHLQVPCTPRVRAKVCLSGASLHLSTADGPVASFELSDTQGTLTLCTDGSTHCDMGLGGLTAMDCREDVYRTDIVSCVESLDTYTPDMPESERPEGLHELLRVSLLMCPSSPYSSEVAVEVKQRLRVVYSARFFDRVLNFFSAQEDDAAGIRSMLQRSGEYVSNVQTQMVQALVSLADPELVDISLCGLVPEVIVPHKDEEADHVRVSGTTMSVVTRYKVAGSEANPYPVKTLQFALSDVVGETSTCVAAPGGQGEMEECQQFLDPFTVSMSVESPIACPASAQASVADTSVRLTLHQEGSEETEGATAADPGPVVLSATRLQYLFLTSFTDSNTNIGGDALTDKRKRTTAEVQESLQSLSRSFVSKMDNLVGTLPSSEGTSLFCQVCVPSLLLSLSFDGGRDEGAFECEVEGLAVTMAKGEGETQCSIEVAQRLSVMDNRTYVQIAPRFRRLLHLTRTEEAGTPPLSFKVLVNSRTGDLVIDVTTSLVGVTAVAPSLAGVAEFFSSSSKGAVTHRGTTHTSAVGSGDTECGTGTGHVDEGARLCFPIDREDEVVPDSDNHPLFHSLSRFLPLNRDTVEGEVMGEIRSVSVERPTLTGYSTLLGSTVPGASAIKATVHTCIQVMVPAQVFSAEGAIVLVDTAATLSLEVVKHQFQRGTAQDTRIDTELHKMDIHILNQGGQRSDMKVLNSSSLLVAYSQQSLEADPVALRLAFPQADALAIAETLSQTRFMDMSALVETAVSLRLSSSEIHALLNVPKEALSSLVDGMAESTATSVSGAYSEYESGGWASEEPYDEDETVGPTFLNVSVRTQPVSVLLTSPVNHPLVEVSLTDVSGVMKRRADTLTGEMVAGLRARYFDMASLKFNNLMQPVTASMSLSQRRTQAKRDHEGAQTLDITRVCLNVLGSDGGTVYVHLPEQAVSALSIASRVLSAGLADLATEPDMGDGVRGEGDIHMGPDVSLDPAVVETTRALAALFKPSVLTEEQIGLAFTGVYKDELLLLVGGANREIGAFRELFTAARTNKYGNHRCVHKRDRKGIALRVCAYAALSALETGDSALLLLALRSSKSVMPTLLGEHGVSAGLKKVAHRLTTTLDGAEQTLLSASKKGSGGLGLAEFRCINRTGLPFVMIGRTDRLSPTLYLSQTDGVLSTKSLHGLSDSLFHSARRVVGVAAQTVDEDYHVALVAHKGIEQFDVYASTTDTDSDAGADGQSERERERVGVRRRVVDILFGCLFEPLLAVPISAPGVFKYAVVPRPASGIDAPSVPVFVRVRQVGRQTFIAVSSKYVIRNRCLTEVRLSLESKRSGQDGLRADEWNMVVPPGGMLHLPLIHSGEGSGGQVRVRVSLTSGSSTPSTPQIKRALPQLFANAEVASNSTVKVLDTFYSGHSYNMSSSALPDHPYSNSDYAIPLDSNVVGTVHCGNSTPSMYKNLVGQLGRHKSTVKDDLYIYHVHSEEEAGVGSTFLDSSDVGMGGDTTVEDIASGVSPESPVSSVPGSVSAETDFFRQIDLQPAMRVANDTPCTIHISLCVSEDMSIGRAKRSPEDMLSVKVPPSSNQDLPFVNTSQHLVCLLRLSLDMPTPTGIERFSQDYVSFTSSPIVLLDPQGRGRDVMPEVCLRSTGKRELRIGLTFDRNEERGGIAFLRVFPPYLVRNALSHHCLSSAILKMWNPLVGVDKRVIRRVGTGEALMFGYASSDAADASDTQGTRLDKAKLYCVEQGEETSLNKADAIQLAGHAADRYPAIYPRGERPHGGEGERHG
ncbi:vacuolar protein sorting-associated protein 13 [Kipferlia bialata]|uniref:Vacuolar protein sorting-associated protein 13 n=1 Tax=Kipferlia bialata TaxID=797122 RepID=A0A9K3CNS0_9EUKA|nr:vacuolar protein sorting-associated protein 13 [Kipferlia bialata]|eukprot:g554.t1